MCSPDMQQDETYGSRALMTAPEHAEQLQSQAIISMLHAGGITVGLSLESQEYSH